MHRITVRVPALSLSSWVLWGKSLPPDCLSFLICKMELLFAPPSQTGVKSCTQRVACGRCSAPISCWRGCLSAAPSQPLHMLTSFQICNYCTSSKVCAVCCLCWWGRLHLEPSRTENAGGRLGKVCWVSRRWGRSSSSQSPRSPESPPLSVLARLVISPSVDPRTVTALFHPPPDSTPFTFLPLN